MLFIVEVQLITLSIIYFLPWYMRTAKESMCGSRGVGDRGSGHPLKNQKTIGFLSNTGLDPLKIKKLPKQHLMFDHHRHDSETPL